MFDSLKHIGIKRRSGRYPWGSGEDPEQRHKSFLGQIEALEKKGLNRIEVAKGMGLTIEQLRNKKTIAKNELKKADTIQAIKLKDKGYSNVAIGKRMGLNESSVRALLNPALKERADVIDTISNILKDNVETKMYLDVGLGVERHLGISRTKLKVALTKLQEEGYKVHKFDITQLGTDKKTNMMVLTKDTVGYGEIMKNKHKIRMTTDYSEDGGRSFLGLEPIRSVDSQRVLIKYAEDGGKLKDGVIELRRGVPELSLGEKRYAQVRIGVDGTHYMKGMAIYSDDIPKGYDIIYNTNKTKDTPQDKVFKEMKDDIDNPFGSTVRQKHYMDKDGKKQLSSLNVVGSKEGSGEEGAWGEWSKNISSQVLSKQSWTLAKKQLGLAFDIKKEEFDEIMSLTNPIVKKKLLESFADDCDSSAVHLKAAALPRQSSHIILPIPSLKETEVYAPNYNNGERVVLIRHPHGGIFEIPELIVNNRHKQAKSILGDVEDAIGIHPKVAEQLSGADFDGDTVIVIPNNKGLIKTKSPFQKLIDFDPKEQYRLSEDVPRMSAKTKAIQMGMVSNLITDMTIKGANDDEIVRAVKHSMVVIDAEKHHLDYKRSAIEHGIDLLKKRYQSGGGASTLISKASSEIRVDARKERIDPTMGRKIYEYTNETYILNGKEKRKQIKTSRMYETEDASTLSSGTPMETIYASHANKLKALANTSRKEVLSTPSMKTSNAAKTTYQSEVASLNSKLNIALKNKPLERQANLIGGYVVASKKAANPNMTADELKKMKGQALIEARSRTQAKKQNIEILPKEWEAIQSGAISNNVLMQILNNTDLDKVKQLATPRTTTAMTPAKIATAKSMKANGYTQSEIANRLGVSTTLLNKTL
jgi:DNA-binding CsgD family transcriptional regulator